MSVPFVVSKTTPRTMRTGLSWSSVSTGVSSQSNILGDLLSKYRSELESSRLLGWHRQKFSELRQIAEEASQPNWDGYGAASINDRAISSAADFLNILPREYLPDEISVDPDGEISFDWGFVPEAFLSISIGPNGMLVYSAMLNGTSQSGREVLRAAIPPNVQLLIEQVRLPA